MLRKKNRRRRKNVLENPEHASFTTVTILKLLENILKLKEKCGSTRCKFWKKGVIGDSGAMNMKLLGKTTLIERPPTRGVLCAK